MIARIAWRALASVATEASLTGCDADDRAQALIAIESLSVAAGGGRVAKALLVPSLPPSLCGQS